jgi:hypothetical protein
MTFGEAVEALKRGKGVRRVGWETGMWIQLAGPQGYQSIAVFVGRRERRPTDWIPTQASIMAEDWLEL